MSIFPMSGIRPFLIAIGLLISFVVPVNSQCIQPDVKNALSSHLGRIGYSNDQADDVEIKYLTTSSHGKKAIQWVSASWMGPFDGALLAFDCQGRFIDIKRVGCVTKISVFDKNNSIKTAAQVETDTPAGTGTSSSAFGIYDIQNNKIHEIWSHTTEEHVYIMTDEMKAVYNFDFDSTGNTINVHGITREIINSKVKTTKSEKSYCWNGSVYTRCK